MGIDTVQFCYDDGVSGEVCQTAQSLDLGPFSTSAKSFSISDPKTNYYQIAENSFMPPVDSPATEIGDEFTIVASIYVISFGAAQVYMANEGISQRTLTQTNNSQGPTPWLFITAEGLGTNTIRTYVDTGVSPWDLFPTPWTQNAWNTIALSLDTNAGIWRGRVNGTVLTTGNTVQAVISDAIRSDTGVTCWGYNPNGSGSQGCSHYLSQIWIDNNFVDFSNDATYAKFFDSNEKPVFLGANGSLPTGTQPLHFAPDGDLTNNRGSGSNWTEVGTVPDAPSSPTD